MIKPSPKEFGDLVFDGTPGSDGYIGINGLLNNETSRFREVLSELVDFPLLDPMLRMAAALA